MEVNTRVVVYITTVGNVRLMLLVSKSIVLSVGLCEPPDKMAAKFCYFRSLSIVSKCLDIPTLLGKTSKFPKITNQKSKKSKNSKK